MKKILALAFAAVFALSCLAGCSGGKTEPSSDPTSDPSEVTVEFTCKDKYNTIVETLGLDIGGEWNDVGDDYMSWLGFDGSEYTDYAGAFKSGNVDVFIIVNPAEGKAEDARTILQKQLDTLIGQNENYPGVNKDKVDAGQVIDTPEGFIALCINGDSDETVENDGGRAALEPMLAAMKSTAYKQ